MNKQLLWVICLVFGLASVSYGMPPKHKPNFQKLAEEISVTDEQLEGFLAVMNEQHEQRKIIHEEGREAVKEKMDALRDELLSKLESVLTEEQVDMLKEKMEKRKREMEKYRMLNAHRGACCH